MSQRPIELLGYLFNAAMIVAGLALWVWMLFNWREVLWLWLRTAVDFVQGTLGFILFAVLSILLLLVVGLVVGLGSNLIHGLNKRGKDGQR